MKRFRNGNTQTDFETTQDSKVEFLENKNPYKKEIIDVLE